MNFNQTAKEYNTLDNISGYINIATMYLKRNNPILNTIKQVHYMVMVLLTINQKISIVKQRVNHMKYRLHQMEQLIDQNNTNKFTKGQTIHEIR